MQERGERRWKEGARCWTEAGSTPLPRERERVCRVLPGRWMVTGLEWSKVER